MYVSLLNIFFSIYNYLIVDILKVNNNQRKANMKKTKKEIFCFGIVWTLMDNKFLEKN